MVTNCKRAVFAVTLLLACASASAAASSGVSLQPLYDSQCSDIVQGRWATFASTLAPEYVGLSLDAPPVSHASAAKSLRGLTELMGANECSVRIVETTQNQKVATATLYFTLGGVLPSATHGMAKGDHVSVTFHSFDTWRITGTEPVQTADVTLGLVVTRNGKRFMNEGQN